MKNGKKVSKWSWLIIVLCLLITASTINLSPSVGAYDTTVTAPTTTMPTTGGYYTTEPTTKYDCEISGHKWVLEDSDGSPCEGSYRWYRCEECGEERTDFIPPTEEHNWEQYGREASCFEDGYIKYICKNTDCFASKTETIPAIGEHDYYYIIHDDATCIEDGTKTLACKRCKFKGETVINEGSALGHNFKNGWQTIKQATCEEKGISIQICNRCLFIESKDIKKANHLDANEDLKCDVCEDDLTGKNNVDKPDTVNCSCNCHKGGVSGLLWKISNFIAKLFKIKSKQICTCGVTHF